MNFDSSANSGVNTNSEESNSQPCDEAVLVEKEFFRFIKLCEDVLRVKGMAYFSIGEFDRQLGTKCAKLWIHVRLQIDDALLERNEPAVIRNGYGAWPNICE